MVFRTGLKCFRNILKPVYGKQYHRFLFRLTISSVTSQKAYNCLESIISFEALQLVGVLRCGVKKHPSSGIEHKQELPTWKLFPWQLQVHGHKRFRRRGLQNFACEVETDACEVCWLGSGSLFLRLPPRRQTQLSDRMATIM